MRENLIFFRFRSVPVCNRNALDSGRNRNGLIPAGTGIKTGIPVNHYGEAAKKMHSADDAVLHATKRDSMEIWNRFLAGGFHRLLEIPEHLRTN